MRSKDLIEARVRTPGTIASLKVDEGDAVEPGQVLALVADPKIALKIKALDAQIVAIQSRVETAKTELERSQDLKAKGVAPQSRVDQAQTTYDVAVNDLKAAQAERSVVETQIEEGQVLAPSAGRVLKVPVTEGSVVLAGESIATIAANEYLLRLELPERHARFIKVGDPVRLGGRGLGSGREAARGRAHRPGLSRAAEWPRRGRCRGCRISAAISSASVCSCGSRPASARHFSCRALTSSSASASTTCGSRARTATNADVIVQTGRDVKERRRQGQDRDPRRRRRRATGWSQP